MSSNSFFHCGVKILLGLCLLLSFATAESQASYRIWHIGNQSVSSMSTDFITFGDDVIYRIGQILFRTNGTTVGTYHLTNLGSALNPIAALNGYVYYTSTSGALNRSNGTPGNDEFFLSTASAPKPICGLGGVLIFFVGYNLHSTNGTLPGTELLYDFSDHYTFSTSSDYPRQFTRQGNYLYFVVGPSNGNHGIWRTDGTVQGTLALIERSNAPLSILTAGDNMVFFSERPSTGVRLWKTDGSPIGTQMVRAFPYSDPFGPSFIISQSYSNGTLWFGVNPMNELWRSNGTAGGTQIVFTFSTLPMGYGRQMQNMLAVGDIVFTRAAEGGIEQHLWRSDGTPSGTYRLVSTETSLPYALNAEPVFRGTMDEKALFQGNDGSGLAFWLSDGSEAGTEKLSDTFYLHSEAFAYKGAYLVAGKEGSQNTDLWGIAKAENLQFICQPRPRNWYYEGDHLDIHVEISLWARDSAEYQWYKDDLPIDGAQAADLFIPMLTIDLSGQYFCRVTLDGGSGSYDSDTVMVRVYREGSMPIATFSGMCGIIILLSLCFVLRRPFVTSETRSLS